MPPYHIRPAIVADAPAVIKGINAICLEGNAFYITHCIPDDIWQMALYRPSEAPEHCLLVAEQEDIFMGAANLFSSPAHTLSTHVAELGLYVLSPYRRQGIGRAMVTQLLNWAIDQSNLEKIVLHVFATNTIALSLYRQFDFVEEGRQHRQVKQGNSYIDMIVMARFLR